jgi:hypothetical protein
MNQYDTITATFNPKRADDLRPGAEQFIGQTFNWIATDIIESGPYAGQWSFMATDDKFPRPVFTVAECDLDIVGCCSHMDWHNIDQRKEHHPDCPTLKAKLTREFHLIDFAGAIGVGMSSPEIWAREVIRHYRGPLERI